MIDKPIKLTIRLSYTQAIALLRQLTEQIEYQNNNRIMEEDKELWK